jgi:HlyD family secretion protein
MSTQSERVRRPWQTLGLAFTVAVLAACSAGSNTSSAPQRSATVTRGTLLASVNATGSIQPEAEIRLGFRLAGTVSAVKVKEGDRVKKGDVLAQLDSADLELAVQQAQAGLITANASYSRTVDRPAQADIDAAQAALNAAYANYEKVKAGPQREDSADAEAALRNADAVLAQASAAYNTAKSANPAGINGSPAALQLEQATNNYNAARARYDRVAKGADTAQLSAALQQVQAAKANLDRLQQPTQSFDLAQAEAQRKQAQLQLEQAQRRLDQARLLAPTDGLISSVGVKVGESVATQPVLTLVDLSKLHIDITVDEIDVAKIKPGQDVNITLDALPDVELKGTIDRIAPTSTTQSGVVSYAVRVVLNVNAGDASLKAGMTANTAVVLDRRENALLAPNWALRRDKPSGKTYLNTRVDDKTSKEVEVKTGVRNETFTEIVSGASEGQVILAPKTNSLFNPTGQ